MTANYEYCRKNRESLPLPIEIHLFEKSKTVFKLFVAFIRSTLNFKHFDKKKRHTSSFFEFIDSQTRAYLSAQKGLYSENPLAVSVLANPKSFWNLQKKYFYPTFSLFWANLSQKNSFLVRSEISRMLVNTLTGNYKYSRSNGESLPLPVQMQLSEKQTSFFQFFICSFLLQMYNRTFNFELLEKKKKWAS